ncbi:hypothetical protein EIP91_005751 [Steccherinum ochraceum]|uniref:Carbohydrate kinase PfkB domain-containing protein n=1 Tax=Steccherinum ochraceum TaxID=92696 RepID=A0A4V2MXF3_9APHY|nr:hypothetical protein EIP91_005751 [Steccherinum ochraceum]
MPHPTNLDTARSVERIVRENGGIPATIGIIEGRVKIGLEPHELERLADVASNPTVVKVSRRDIGPVLSLKKDGGTTCSSTLIFAALSGIKVFATGGLGGVHRGGEDSMDVSADLQELTRCSVGLVSAGVKSILDIGRTLEYLETLGVPVVSYAESNDFPAFYTRRSGFQSPWHTSDPQSAASILRTQHQLGMSNGVMFAVPIPEAYEEVGQEIQKAVELALREADENGMSRRGKEVTPWLLKRVSELTTGKSLPSNIALIENTARVGTQIAAAYARMENNSNSGGSQPSLNIAFNPPKHTSDDPSLTPSPVDSPAKLVIIGSSAVDITSQLPKEASLTSHSTVPGSVTLSLGGVARNIAEAAHRSLVASSPASSHETLLVSAVGQDSFGRLLSEESRQIGMRTDGFVLTSTARTAVCNMMLDSDGGLTGGVADMDIIQSLDTATVLDTLENQSPSLVALDGNLSEKTLSSVVRSCNERGIPVFFEPTSVAKSVRILSAMDANTMACWPVAFASPNLLELAHMYRTAGEMELTQSNAWWQAIDAMGLGSEYRLSLEQLARRDASDRDQTKGTLSFLLDRGVAQMAVHLLPLFQHLVIKCGDLGVIVVFRITANPDSKWLNERSNIHARQVVAHGQPGSCVVVKHFPSLALDPEVVVNVTGAGDSLVGSLLSSLVQTPQLFEDLHALDTAIQQAQKVSTYKTIVQDEVLIIKYSRLQSKLYKVHWQSLRYYNSPCKEMQVDPAFPLHFKLQFNLNPEAKQ